MLHRISTPTTLLLGAAVLLRFTTADPDIACIQPHSLESAALTACGADAGPCLSSLVWADSDADCLAQVEQCYVSTGCTPDEAHIVALWAIRSDSSNDPNADLRRRSPSSANNNNAMGAMPLPRSLVITSIVAARDSAAPTGSPSPCFTETQVSVTVCTTPAGASTHTCIPTTAPSSVCASGLICHQDSDGNPSCMYAQNGLPTAGIIVAIAIASAVVLGVFAICFFACRESRNQRQLEREQEAKRIVREAASSSSSAAARATAQSVTQPLMAPPLPSGPGGVAAGHDYPQQMYQNDSSSGANPFVDQQAYGASR
jgi:hypothetical protein